MVKAANNLTQNELRRAACGLESSRTAWDLDCPSPQSSLRLDLGFYSSRSTTRDWMQAIISQRQEKERCLFVVPKTAWFKPKNRCQTLLPFPEKSHPHNSIYRVTRQKEFGVSTHHKRTSRMNPASRRTILSRPRNKLDLCFFSFFSQHVLCIPKLKVLSFFSFFLLFS